MAGKMSRSVGLVGRVAAPPASSPGASVPVKTQSMNNPEYARRVYLGKIKGETPRKEIFFSRDDAPNTVGSATPQRQELLGAPLKSSLSSKSSSANFLPSAASDGTPEKLALPPRQPERPTTSRGKAHPSPDEFANYIQQSPPSKVDFERGTSTVMSFADDAAAAAAAAAAAGATAAATYDESDDESEGNPFRGDWSSTFAFPSAIAAAGGSEDGDEESEDDGDLFERRTPLTSEQLSALRGCWLFGVALQV